MTNLTSVQIALMIDHTNLRPDAVADDIIRLCDEALEFKFGAVCVAPTWIRLAADRLKNSDTKVATVIGFPHGNTLPAVKAFEAQQAISEGAHEIDMVVNIGALKEGNEQYVRDDIAGVVNAVHAREERKIKVILETAYLGDAEKDMGCRLAERAGADFVKTSTGFADSGATIEDVALFKRVIGGNLGIKAAGGIRTPDDVFAMLKAGATRLGCSSSVDIIKHIQGLEEKMSDDSARIDLKLEDLMNAKRPVGAGSDSTTDEFYYKWKIFEKRLQVSMNFFNYHAQQRYQAFNFFILFAGILAAAFATLIEAQQFILASCVSGLGCLIAYCFACIEHRNEELVHIAEDNLGNLEKDVLFDGYCREIEWPHRRRRIPFLWQQKENKEKRQLGFQLREKADLNELGKSYFRHGRWIPTVQYLIVVAFFLGALGAFYKPDWLLVTQKMSDNSNPPSETHNASPTPEVAKR